VFLIFYLKVLPVTPFSVSMSVFLPQIIKRLLLFEFTEYFEKCL